MKRNLLPCALAAIGALFSAMPAIADGPGWTASPTVVKMVVVLDGGVNVRLSPDVNGCTSQSGYGPNFVSIPASHPGINRMEAALLAAYLAGKPVRLYLVDSRCYAAEMMLGSD